MFRSLTFWHHLLSLKPLPKELWKKKRKQQQHGLLLLLLFANSFEEASPSPAAVSVSNLSSNHSLTKTEEEKSPCRCENRTKKTQQTEHTAAQHIDSWQSLLKPLHGCVHTDYTTLETNLIQDKQYPRSNHQVTCTCNNNILILFISYSYSGLFKFSVASCPQRPYGLLGTGSQGRPPRLSHSS